MSLRTADAPGLIGDTSDVLLSKGSPRVAEIALVFRKLHPVGDAQEEGSPTIIGAPAEAPDFDSCAATGDEANWLASSATASQSIRSRYLIRRISKGYSSRDGYPKTHLFKNTHFFL
ncbi:hypothetical protein EBT16_13515 [bacterium]|nr:hypothetical protein [bacterium]